jgi:hypothetical protein
MSRGAWDSNNKNYMFKLLGEEGAGVFSDQNILGADNAITYLAERLSEIDFFQTGSNDLIKQQNLTGLSANLLGAETNE